MKFDELKFDFDDIKIVPKPFTEISSRKKVDVCHYKPITLPIIAAPMDTVVDLTNINFFIDNKIGVALPRTVKKYQFDLPENKNLFKYNGLDQMIFVSYGLTEMK
ncbi:unnamed protein product, partial [marine sediment metagenome]